MLEQEFTIVNKLGLHARASALLVKTASRFHSEVRLEREGVKVNGKSIMGILMLALGPGTAVRLKTNGSDEEEAMQVLSGVLGRHAD